MVKGVFCLLLLIVTTALGPFAHGHTVPELITLDQLMDDKDLARSYYDQLKIRFKNRNFDEVLLPEQFHRAPRLSFESYLEMLSTFQHLVKDLGLEPTLGQTSDLPIVRISPDGRLEYLDDSLIRSWSDISRLFIKRFEGLGFGHGTPDRQIKTLRYLVELANRQQFRGDMTELADALLCTSLGSRRYEFLKKHQLTDFLQYRVLEDAEKSAKVLAKTLGVAGRVIDKLIEHSTFRTVQRTNFFKKGIVIAPMTRMEGLFKSIGTGECARTACNRYMDTLYQDAFHLKVLNDGEEIGYLGIYKTISRDKKIKRWLLETIQTPILGDQHQLKYIKGLLTYLQQRALLDDSLLSLPGGSEKTYYTYNFKPVVASLGSIIENANYQIVESEYRHAEEVKNTNLLLYRRYAQSSQYLTQMVGDSMHRPQNAMAIGGGRMIELPPLLDQPSWVFDRYLEIHQLRDTVSLSSDPLRRKGEQLLSLLKVYDIWSYRKWLFDYREKIEDSKLNFYRYLPRRLMEAPFAAQFEYFKEYSTMSFHSADKIQSLREEVFLKVETVDQYLALTKSRGLKSGRFPQFLASSLDRFLPAMTEAQAMGLYESVLNSIGIHRFGVETARKIETRIQDSEKYVQFIYLSFGQVNGNVGISEEKLRQHLLLSTWKRHVFREQGWEKRYRLASRLLTLVGRENEFKVRSELLQTATDLSQIFQITESSSLNEGTDIWHAQYKSLVAKKFNEVIRKNISRDYLERNRSYVRHFLKVLGSTDKIEYATTALKSLHSYENFEWMLHEGLLSRSFLPEEIDQRLQNDLATLLVDNALVANLERKILAAGRNALLDSKLTEDLITFLEKVIQLPVQFQIEVFHRLSKRSPIFLARAAPEYEKVQALKRAWSKRLVEMGFDSAERVLGEFFAEPKKGKLQVAASAVSKFCSNLLQP